MTNLTADEMKVLDVIDGTAAQPGWIRANLRPVFDDLLRRGFIEAQTRYVLSGKGRAAIEARDNAAPQ